MSTHELDRLVRQLEQALQARDELLSVASHELRTPLSVLKLRLDLLLRQAHGDSLAAGTLVDALGVAVRQTTRLIRLVDGLLDVSRIAWGRLLLQPEAVDLSQVVAEVADGLRGAIEGAGGSIALRLSSGVVGWWDRLRLEQVVENLITNAVKHGGPSPIDVAVSRHAGRATLVVRDRGPGIPEAEQRRIFDRFARAAPDGVGGLGLGLYIARQIVEAHGGRIGLESRPGEGAAFSVSLPIGRPPPG